jgi:hypothetical protein
LNKLIERNQGDIYDYISFSCVGQVANDISHKWQLFMDGKKSQQNTCSFIDPLYKYCHL